MPEKKLLSISVAAYNVESCLEKCLDSFIIPEIENDLEVIIVNDGSKDRTIEIARKYQEKKPGLFKVIDKENGGHGSTINAAAKVASAKYFKIVDADDWVEEKGIITLVNALRNTKADVIFSPFFYVDSKTFEKTYKFYSNYPLSDDLYDKDLSTDELTEGLFLPMHAMTLRTDLIQNTKYRLDEHCFYVDAEYVVFYFQNVEKVLFLREPVYDYRVGDNGQSVNTASMHRNRENHLRMCKSVIAFYVNESEKMKPRIRNIIKYQITGNIITEYRLLLSLEDTNVSRNEIKDFDHMVKEKSGELYDNVLVMGSFYNSGSMKLINYMRKAGFFGYSLVHLLLKKKFYQNMGN